MIDVFLWNDCKLKMNKEKSCKELKRANKRAQRSQLFAWFFNIFSIIFTSLSLTKKDLFEYNIWIKCHCAIIIFLNCKLQVLRITDFWTCNIQLTCLTQPNTVWHGLTLSEMTWDNLTMSDMAWHNLKWPDIVWNGLIQSTLFDKACQCLIMSYTDVNCLWHS